MGADIQDLLVLHTLDEIRVLSEPLRVQILEALTGDPLTIKQVAERLGEKPTKLYHHFELMETTGLIRKVKTQKKRGTIETYYQATAKDFTLAPDLFTASSPSHESVQTLQDLFASLLQTTLSELRASLRAGLIVPEGKNAMTTLAGIHIEATPEQLDDIHGKLRDLIKTADKTQGKGGPLTYNLTVAFFPVQKSETKPAKSTKRSRR